MGGERDVSPSLTQQRRYRVPIRKALAATATMYVVRRYQGVLHRFAAALITLVVKHSAQRPASNIIPVPNHPYAPLLPSCVLSSPPKMSLSLETRPAHRSSPVSASLERSCC